MQCNLYVIIRIILLVDYGTGETHTYKSERYTRFPIDLINYKVLCPHSSIHGDTLPGTFSQLYVLNLCKRTLRVYAYIRRRYAPYNSNVNTRSDYSIKFTF